METAKDNFLSITERCDFKNSRFVVVPFGFESTTSYAKGATGGTRAIIKASAEVELFDEKLGYEPYKRFGIATLKPFPIPKNREKAFAGLRQKIEEIVNSSKIPVVLGGEHSVSLPAILALKKKYEDIAVLHFDAHSDLRPSYENDPLNHACAMHAVLPHVSFLASLGVRNFSAEEVPVLRKNKNKIKIFWADDFRKKGAAATIKKVLPLLKGRNIYLSFDVDVFDISLIGSSTGTPEPGGLDYYHIIDCFESILPKVNLIGADFVELRPIKNFHAPDFLVAKTLYKALTAASV